MKSGGREQGVGEGQGMNMRRVNDGVNGGRGWRGR